MKIQVNSTIQAGQGKSLQIWDCPGSSGTVGTSKSSSGTVGIYGSIISTFKWNIKPEAVEEAVEFQDRTGALLLLLPIQFRHLLITAQKRHNTCSLYEMDSHVYFEVHAVLQSWRPNLYANVVDLASA